MDKNSYNQSSSTPMIDQRVETIWPFWTVQEKKVELKCDSFEMIFKLDDNP